MNYIKKSLLALIATGAMTSVVDTQAGMKTALAYSIGYVQGAMTYVKPVVALGGIYVANNLHNMPWVVDKVLPWIGRSTKQEAQVLGSVASVLGIMSSIPPVQARYGDQFFWGAIGTFGIYKVASSTWLRRGIYNFGQLFSKELIDVKTLDKETAAWSRYRNAKATVSNISQDSDKTIANSVKQRIAQQRTMVDIDYVANKLGDEQLSENDLMKAFANNQQLSVQESVKALNLKSGEKITGSVLKNKARYLMSEDYTRDCIQAEKERLIAEEDAFVAAYEAAEAKGLGIWFTGLAMWGVIRNPYFNGLGVNR